VFPIGACFAKMLVLGNQGNCLDYVIGFVAAMSSDLCRVQKNLRENKKANDPSSFSDLLAMLKIVGGYSCSKDRKQFSKECGVGKKTLDEAMNIMRQLVRLIQQCCKLPNYSLRSIKERPTQEQEHMLKQIITSGLIHHLARKWPKGFKPEGYDEAIPESAYQCVSKEDPVYIHPSSQLFPAVKQPDYLVYHQLHQTKKSYLKICTAVDPNWIHRVSPHLCTLSTLEDPPPRYDRQSDKVIAFSSVKFSLGNWDLPLLKQELEDGKLKAAYFARAILEGAVLPKLKEIQPYLLQRPAQLTSKNQLGRYQQLALTLFDARCFSKGALMSRKKEKPEFLEEELKVWVHKAKHDALMRILQSL